MSDFELLRNPLKQRLDSGGLGLCLIVQKFTTVEIALAAQSCGFDALYVDLEHSVISESDAAQICIAGLLVGVTPLVRVPNHAPEVMGRMLDAGALGVIAPHVESAAQARRIVDACKFAPCGHRSVSYQWPHLKYKAHADASAVRQAFNNATTVIVMIESAEAVERAVEIAAVPGVDMLHVGSADLADSLGVPGQLDSPAMLKSFERVIAACQQQGKVAGIGSAGGRPQLAEQVVRLGARFLSAGIDWDLMLSGSTQRVTSLRRLDLHATAATS